VIKPLRIHRLAEDELADASSWYEVKQPGLGISLLNLIDETVERVGLVVCPAALFLE
jgi:hypothetical protein